MFRATSSVSRGIGSKSVIGLSWLNPPAPLCAFVPLWFKNRSMRGRGAVLEGAGAEQEVDDVAFVRLQPVEGDRFYRADVEAVDVRRVEQLAGEFRILGDARADQGGL